MMMMNRSRSNVVDVVVLFCLRLRRRDNRRGKGGGGGMIIKEEVVIEEAEQGEANSSEGVEIGEVSFGEDVAVVDSVVKEGTAFTAEGHRWKVVKLGA